MTASTPSPAGDTSSNTSGSTSGTPPLPMLLVVSCSASWVVAQLSYTSQPLLLDPIKKTFDLSDESVTQLFGYELFVFAIMALVIAGPLARVSRVAIALLGAVIAITGSVLSSLVDSYSMLIACRLLVGMGGALVGAAGTAAAASSAHPERVFAIITITSNLLLSFEPAMLEWFAFGPYGMDGGFLALAITIALFMPVLLWLSPPPRTASSATFSPWAALLQAPNRALAIAAMFALLIYETGQGGIWTYMAEIGERSNLADQAVANTMSAAALLGLLGAFLAFWIGDRFGSKWPIVLGIGINVSAAVGLGFSASPAQFIVLNTIWYAAYYFVTPYLLGVMAKLDDLGRWAVAVDAMWWLGDATGPPIAGLIVERSGYDLLAVFPACTGAISITIFMRMLRRFGSEKAAST